MDDFDLPPVPGNPVGLEALMGPGLQEGCSVAGTGRFCLPGPHSPPLGGATRHTCLPCSLARLSAQQTGLCAHVDLPFPCFCTPFRCSDHLFFQILSPLS